MSVVEKTNLAPDESSEEPTFQIDFWPMRDEWRQAWPLLLLAIAMVSATAWVTRSAGATAIAAAILAVACWPLLIPARIVLSGRGIHLIRLGRKTLCPWDGIRSAEVLQRGVLLRGFGQGITLTERRFFIPGDQQTDVVQFALEQFHSHARFRGGSSLHRPIPHSQEPLN